MAFPEDVNLSLLSRIRVSKADFSFFLGGKKNSELVLLLTQRDSSQSSTVRNHLASIEYAQRLMAAR